MRFALRVISRRPTPMNADEKWQRAERKAHSVRISLSALFRSSIFNPLFSILIPPHSVLSTRNSVLLKGALPFALCALLFPVCVYLCLSAVTFLPSCSIFDPQSSILNSRSPRSVLSTQHSLLSIELLMADSYPHSVLSTRYSALNSVSETSTPFDHFHQWRDIFVYPFKRRLGGRVHTPLG